MPLQAAPPARQSRSPMLRGKFSNAGLLAAFLVAGLGSPSAHCETEVEASRSQAERSLSRLNGNLDLPGLMSGVVVASPSRSSPDYYYHWVRDAGLVMGSYVDIYNSADPIARQDASRRLLSWIGFETRLQGVPNMSGGLGEPKFNVDGTAFALEWGRPQNDGPALRALTMTRFAEALLAEGKGDVVTRILYRAELPATSPLKTDLEFVAQHWRDPSYDLWEEVKARHLYTRLVQRAALLRGARLAQTLGDAAAGAHYAQQAALITAQLTDHRDATQGYLLATLDRVDGWKHKVSGLDIAVLLGALHAGGEGDGFDVDDEWLLATVDKLRVDFTTRFPLNAGASTPLMGRYPEDIYDGVGFSVGHPWYLATHAVAELDCKLATKIRAKGSFTVTARSAGFFANILGKPVANNTVFTAGTPAFTELTEALDRNGRSYLNSSRSHAGSGGALSEQIDRTSGQPRGAADLSWSYASYLTAHRACFP